jgi:hypothetical protein
MSLNNIAHASVGERPHAELECFECGGEMVGDAWWFRPDLLGALSPAVVVTLTSVAVHSAEAPHDQPDAHPFHRECLEAVLSL